MSFILDAIKKADAERRLGEVPGIHSPAAPVRTSAGPGFSWPARQFALRAAGVSAAVLIAAFLSWQFIASGVPAKSAGTVPTVASETPPQPAAPARLAARNPVPDAPATAGPEPAAAPKPAVTDELPVPPPLPKPAPKAPADPAALPAKPGPATAQAKPAAPETLPRLGELPPQLQSELPSLAFSGSMYSENPANRMVLLNRRLLREGDEIAPGLVLETLAPNTATLRYKGHRFQVGY